MSHSARTRCFVCDQIGDRVLATVQAGDVLDGEAAPLGAQTRLLACSGASQCGWRAPGGECAPGPCAFQRVLLGQAA
jgi:hypothetical protein